MNKWMHLPITATLAENNTAIYRYNVDRTSRKVKPSLTDAPDKKILAYTKKNITMEVRNSNWFTTIFYSRCMKTTNLRHKRIGPILLEVKPIQILIQRVFYLLKNISTSCFRNDPCVQSTRVAWDVIRN